MAEQRPPVSPTAAAAAADDLVASERPASRGGLATRGGVASPFRGSGTPMLRTPGRTAAEMDMVAAQGRLQQEYASIQRRAQELMSTMDIPDGPMPDYDEPRPVTRGSVASKLASGSRPPSANFTIGAGVPAAVASDFHQSLSQLDQRALPAEGKLHNFRAAAFDARDPETPVTGRDPGAGIMFEEERQPKKYRKQTEINWVGLLAYIFFYCAFGFYLWIRITKTLDLGLYLGYGIFVLAVEVIGASTVMLYGVNLLFNPVIEKFVEDPDLPGRPKVDLPYHVRVLVPCYKEDLAIVRRTVMAAYDALLPAGCARTIYLCDDGRDPKKRKFCDALGPEVVYVSGRKRDPGEMNGKSGNINNCCSQIYPKGTKIPPNELVCIFDADQVCSTSFYLKTLPLFDGGDDVGMVLSPQCFHNLNMHADIFNHSNVHFWEYMQPGYDALGFISCTGTNFVVRAAALKEVGGSPTYTLTEDFALGMALKMYGWHCRYVQEYLAIGEAPDQIRNCYQQRSRWCKGHFQIIFNGDHCPLLQSRLSFGMKLMYCSGVWSYVVGAISTPTFIIIPMITIWFGVFPIVINWWAALGVTVYGVSTQLVLYYTRSAKHVEALWFANVGNQILWWTYVKACWRAVGSLLSKKGITFKTTMKGGGLMAAGNMRDLWMPLLCLLLLAASFIYGLVDLGSGSTPWSPLIISVLWALYNMIPPLLVVWYGWVSTGNSLQWLCRICLPLSFVTMSLALAFMWFLYPKKFNYSENLTDAMYYYEANMLGNLPAGYDIPWRGDAFTNDTTVDGADITGGWITGGKAGIVRMTIPAAFTTTVLAWSMLSFPKAYIESGSVQRSMDQLQWGADYLRKTFDASSTNSTSGSIVYQVGNYTQLKQYWGHVEDLDGPNPTYSVKISDGASDLGGQVVAALAATSLVFRESDPAYASDLLAAATTLYGAISSEDNQGVYSNIQQPDCRRPGDPDVAVGGVRLPLCGALGTFLAADDGGVGGSAIDLYLSNSFYDDLAWAAAWLYRASENNDVSYLIDAQAFYVRHINGEAGADKLIYNYDNMYWALNVFLAQVINDDAAHERTRYFLKQWICGANPGIKFTDKGQAYNLNSNNYLATQTAVFLSSVYGNVVHRDQKRRSKRYLCWARAQMRYIMGDHKRSYVVGYGQNPPTHAANMPASCPNRPLPCTVFSAYLTPNPNPHVLTGALVQAEYGSDSFSDVRNLNDTLTSIELNAGFTGALAGLAKAPGTWEQCLQGYGIFNIDRAVCRD